MVYLNLFAWENPAIQVSLFVKGIRGTMNNTWREKNESFTNISHCTHSFLSSFAILMGRMVLLSLDHEWSNVCLQTGEFQSHIVVHTDPVVLLCFQANKCRKSNFTVVGGWKWHQQFQSSVSLLRMLGLDVEPEVRQTFLPESCLQCPIWCNVHKAVNLSWWSLDLTWSMFVLSRNGFLILSNLASNSGKYVPRCKWRSCRCCLKDATVLPSTSSPAARRKSTGFKFSPIETTTPQSHLEACGFNFVLDIEDGDSLPLQHHIQSTENAENISQVCQLRQFLTMVQEKPYIVLKFKKTGENFSACI